MLWLLTSAFPRSEPSALAAGSGLPLCLSSRQAGRRLCRSLLYSLYRMLPWLRRISVYENTAPASASRSGNWDDCKKKVLMLLSDAGRSPLDIILNILDLRQEEYEQYRSRWFSSNCSKFSALLDHTFEHPKGRGLILHWFSPHLLELVCSTVASEMDLVVKELSLLSVEHVSSKFISKWTLERVVEPAMQLCPSLLHILEVAAQTEEAKQKNKIKLLKTVRNLSSA